jgi:HAD superfamily hydrolase (TIGR01484 family)
MRPLDAIPAEALARVSVVFTDVDDTLTTRGRLTAGAYTAIERLDEAGVAVVPVTGRPAGWCDHIARMWPVSGVVGENGAFYFRYQRDARRMLRRYAMGEEERAQAAQRVGALAREILAAVPGSAIAADQAYREVDLAIDHCEDVPALDAQAVDRIVELFERAGATAKVSSIHVNGWIGKFDKLVTARLFAAECLELDLDVELERAAFVGDSPNDAPMFAHFPLAIGVANVFRYRDRIVSPPAYVTPSEGGAGFTELAARVLDARHRLA